MSETESPEMERSEDEQPSERLMRVRRAVEEWTKQLIDLTGRNQLLYYKTQKRGTLELTDAERTSLDALLAGRSARLSHLLPATEEHPDRDVDALRRAQTLHRRSVALYEERGIQTLYLAWGMATWHTDSSAATPAAPVLLRPLMLSAAGAAEREFRLELDGDWEVNETLLHLLATEFQINADAQVLNSSLAQPDGGAPDPSRVYELLSEHAEEVPCFAITQRVVAGTFTYTKLPMVRDLKESADSLAEHEVIAALAGDEEARAVVREMHARDVDASDPDRVPPQDEFLILDADSSQQYAINAAVAGEPLVIQGPPGTGKSQTIANLIATMAARGKRVLFVAEKRAAIDAVAKRLDEVGLSELMLDLHGGSRSKKQLATELSETLERIKATATVDLDDLHDGLVRTRTALREHVAALHEPRDPWGLSLWQVHERLLGLDGTDPGIRWSTDQLTVLDAQHARDVRDALEEWGGLIGPFLDRRTDWADAAVTTVEDAQETASIAQQLAALAPSLRDNLAALATQSGHSSPTTLRDWSSALQLLDSVRQTCETLDEGVWDEDLSHIAQQLAPGRRSVWSRMAAQLFDADYRRAKQSVRARWRGAERASTSQLAHAVEAARTQAAAWPVAGWTGRPRALDAVQEAQRRHQEAMQQIAALGSCVRYDLADEPYGAVPQRAAALVGDQATLYRLPRIHGLEAWLMRQHCHALLDAIRRGEVPWDQTRAAFDQAWLASIRSHLLASDRRLAGFDGDLLRRRASEFAEADRLHIRTAPQRVQRAVAECAVAMRGEHPAEDETVTKQARRKRGHLSLRQLVHRAPHVVTSLRPCWAMSPLVVSQSLPSEQLFDVVVFDEASQVTPADAVPAIARARQVVVAGDDQQLPPTAFFDGDTVDGQEGADEDDGALVTGFESILDVLGALLRKYVLTWHYRSQCEGLIAFSNHYVYDGALVTFPGAAGHGCLDFRLVPHRPGVPVDSRSNDDEVAHVVERMIDHALCRAEESLGVIALGSHHADRIEAALRDRIAEENDPELEAFFDETKQERAFVKNLERVQGDERDAIILSTGYAKSPDGRVLYRFGPLNQEGGKRRLNVAVTRARRRLTLVASFSHTEMAPDKGSEGARLLRSYLKYAASGGTDLDGAETNTPLNAFEHDVKTRLEAAGLTVIPQYGTSGYRLDFAVPDPKKPHRMLLAIEADGASYHAAPTARDRDRLRQQVLERLGWRFHRIWSTDWFNNPEAETAKVLEAVRQAQDGDPGDPPPPDGPTPPPAPTPAGSSRGERPHIAPGGEISDYGHDQLVALANWIRSDTLLRTEDELLAELMGELGFKRRGQRIVAALRAAIRDSKR